MSGSIHLKYVLLNNILATLTPTSIWKETGIVPICCIKFQQNTELCHDSILGPLLFLCTWMICHISFRWIPIIRQCCTAIGKSLSSERLLVTIWKLYKSGWSWLTLNIDISKCLLFGRSYRERNYESLNIYKLPI